MRLARLPNTAGPGAATTWPPLLATRGPGGRSATHAHHAMHVVVALGGTLRVAPEEGEWREAHGVLTPADAPHAIDATGVDVLLVFLDPESAAGASLAAVIGRASRLLDAREAAAIAGADPMAIMGPEGPAIVARFVAALGAAAIPEKRRVHPRVRKALRALAARAPGDDPSLDALAADVGLSPGRFMHVFTESIGVPFRPYLAWRKVQGAAAAIASGAPLAAAAREGGFVDAGHMSRTFRRTFGVPPSALRPSKKTAS